MSSLPNGAASTGFSLSPSKASRLEKRLLGSSGPLSRDGLSLQGPVSSVVGFAQPNAADAAMTHAHTDAGRVGFDHIGRAGQVVPHPTDAAGGPPGSPRRKPSDCHIAPPSGNSVISIASASPVPSSNSAASPTPAMPRSAAAAAALLGERTTSRSPPAHAMAASRIDSQSSTRMMAPVVTTTAVGMGAHVVLVPNAPPPAQPTPPGGLRRNTDILREQMDAAAAAIASVNVPSHPPVSVNPFDVPLSLPPPPAQPPAAVAPSPTKTIRPSAAAKAAAAAAAAAGGAPVPAGTKRKAASPSPRQRKPKGDGTTTAKTTRSRKGGVTGTPESAAASTAAATPSHAAQAADSATDGASPHSKRAKLPPQSLNATLNSTAQPAVSARTNGRSTTPPPSAYASLTHPLSPSRGPAASSAAAAAAAGLSPLQNSAASLPGGGNGTPPLHVAPAHAAPHQLERMTSEALGSRGKDIKSYFGGGAPPVAPGSGSGRRNGSGARQVATPMQIDSDDEPGSTHQQPSSTHFASQTQSTWAASQPTHSQWQSQSQSQPLSLSQPGMTSHPHSSSQGGVSSAAGLSAMPASATATRITPAPGLDTDSDSEVMIISDTHDGFISQPPATATATTSSHTPQAVSSRSSAATPDGHASVKRESGGAAAAAATASTTPPSASTPTPTAAASSKKKCEPKSRKKKESVSTSPLGATHPPCASSTPTPISSAELAKLHADTARCREWEAALLARERMLDEREQALEARIAATAATGERVAALEAALAQEQGAAEAYRARITDVVHELFIELCDSRDARTEEKLIRDAVSIGRLVPARASDMGHFGGGLHVHDQWEDGEVIKEIRARIAHLNKEKEEVEAQKKKLTRKKASVNRAAKQEEAAAAAASSGAAGSNMLSSMGLLPGGNTGPAASASGAATASSGGGLMGAPAPRPPRTAGAAAAASAAAACSDLDDDDPHDGSGFARPAPVDIFQLREAEEVASMRLALLKNALAEQEAKAESWDVSRKTLVRLAKLHAEQRASPLQNHPILAKRYVVLHLLGKGGFSEVHQAFDLQELRYVACKVHQLNPQWTQERKVNYTKRATREYNIHKTLQHPRIVALLDVFAIHSDAFATVLEYCDGQDLDMYLKLKGCLSERESRAIIGQVFSALRYINARNDTIIHYDLKPGNILFHKGEVKITDFGLSKVVMDAASDTGGIELTSQGAGTYWYLPPECLRAAGNGRAPTISSAVDVYSCGVILFQMLYGRKPFGQGLSSDDMAGLSQRTGPESHRVTFPDQPAVSKASQEFIAHCLMYDPAKRPSIKTLHTLPYFNQKAVPQAIAK